MMRGLLAKELREHRVLFLFLFLLLASGMTLIGAHSLIRRVGGSGFFAVRFGLVMMLPLACLVLNHSLIASEFRQKTQLFLEGLPLPRWRMLFVKYALGLILVMFALWAVLFAAWWPARGTEAMTPRFAVLLLLKAAAWTWFIYALFYAHAFLGRYRIAFAVLLLVVFISLQMAGVETSRFAPFQLIDERFAFERFRIPTAALWTTIGLSLLLTALGFGLGLVRDATVASLLAEKMSSREKVFITFLGIAGVMLAGYLQEHYTKATPVKLPGASEGLDGVAQVYAAAAVDAPTREETAQLTRIARETANELAELAAYLRCNSLPPVFIVHRRDLAANDFQDGDLKYAQGLMVRANLTAPGFEMVQLQSWINRRILIARTRGIADRERNAWVLDGFVAWRANSPGSAHHSKSWPRIVSMAKEVLPRDFSPEHLERWYTVRHEAGKEKAASLAAMGFATLAERYGDEACRQFATDLFSKDYPADARGWLRDILNPDESRLRRAANVSMEDFVKQWREAVLQAPAQP